MLRTLAPACAGLALLVAPLTAHADGLATTGSERVLVISATYDGQPSFTLDEVKSDVGQMASFLSSASYGKLAIQPDFTPLLQLPAPTGGCPDQNGFASMTAAAKTAAAAAGFPSASYTRFLFVGPLLCMRDIGGLGGGDSAWVDAAAIYPFVFEHEFGHSLGLGHAASCDILDPATGLCASVGEYGDDFDVMGSGGGDFDALHLAQLGWLTPTRVAASGDYPLAPISTTPQALAIPSTLGTYSIEDRASVGVDKVGYQDYGDATILIDRVPSSTLEHATAIDTLQLARLTADQFTPRPAAFSVPGLFSVTMDAAGGGSAVVHFRWLDATPPSAPDIEAVPHLPTDSSPTFTLASTDDATTPLGSGIAYYEASFDGAPPVRLANDELLPAAPLAAGPHTIQGDAVDYAGNRSDATNYSFAVQSRPHRPALVVRLVCAAGRSAASACRVKAGRSQSLTVSGVGMPGGRLQISLARLRGAAWRLIRKTSATPSTGGLVSASLRPASAGLWRVQLSAPAHDAFLAASTTRYLRAR
jgi:hypothetical protein